MTSQEFCDVLESLELEAWQSVIDGYALFLLDDHELQVAPVVNDPRVIIAPPKDDDITAEAFRVQSLEQADEVLAGYYRTHPLTRKGFDRQVESLFKEHGSTTFAATPSQFPKRTLFVDVGTVVAEGRESPRHRYGAFLELDKALSGIELERAVRNWFESGRAYEEYLGMNVCRYNC